MNKEYNSEYFKKYEDRNILGMKKGSKPFMYSYWSKKIRKRIPGGSRILEVGCGYGFLLKWLEGSYDISGIDISGEAINETGKKVKGCFRVGDAHSLEFENNAFLCVIAFDVVEHLKEPEKFLAEAGRVLGKGGYLILSTPNPESVGCRMKKKDWFARKDSTHISIKKIAEWRNLIRHSGFNIVSDGTDTLWDVPYFRFPPAFAQKLLFVPFHWLGIYLFGFFPWKFGENYICIARKQ